MTEVDVIDIVREAIWVMLKVSGVPMVVGLIVGVAVSLVQALTQIQEMTLTFVPKIIVIFISIVLFAPFMLSEMNGLMETIAIRIAAIE
jgi:flagellar biosynthetic protein FliQ